MTNWKQTLKYIAPPFGIDLAKELKRKLRNKPHSWEHVPQGWQALATGEIKGWNTTGVREAYQQRWKGYQDLLKSNLPLVTAPEHFSRTDLDKHSYNNLDLILHNTILCYAYALSVAARLKQNLSILDWGGGIGHYYLLSEALIPDLNIEYHCVEVAVLAEQGREMLPQVHFYSDDNWQNGRYDLVLTSVAFHYEQNWTQLLETLAQVSTSYVFITQLPIIHQANSFVMVQRPYDHGYQTEYLGWCLNRTQFLDEAGKAGLKLVREFINGFQPSIHRAPEQAEYRGYLFTIR